MTNQIADTTNRNVCHCCHKTTGKLTDHHVVPRRINKNFPELMKHVNLVPLCESCHVGLEKSLNRYEKKNRQMLKELVDSENWEDLWRIYNDWYYHYLYSCFRDIHMF